MSFQPPQLDSHNATIKLNCLVSALLIMLLLILWMQPRDPPTQLDIDNAPFKLNCLLAALLIMIVLITWMKPREAELLALKIGFDNIPQRVSSMQPRDAELPAWKIWFNKIPHEFVMLCLSMFVVTYVK